MTFTEGMTMNSKKTRVSALMIGVAGLGLGLSVVAGPAAAATDSNLPRVLQPKVESIQPKHEHPQYPTSASCPICKENGVWKRQV